MLYREDSSSLWPCSACCGEHWVPRLISFDDSCVGAISYLPAWIAVVIVLFRYGLGPAWRRRPLWLRTFAAEQASRSEELGPSRLEADGEVDSADLPRVKAWHWPAICLLILSILDMAFGLFLAFAFRFGPVYLVPVVPCILTALVVAIDRPRTAPGAVLLVQLALFSVQLAHILAIPAMLHWPSGLFTITQMGITLFVMLTVIAMPLRDPQLDVKEICSPFETPTSQLRSPEDNISVWQWMSVTWMSPLIAIAFDRQLHDEDVWFLPYEFQHSRLHLLFREVKGSVTGRILKANATDLLITSSLGILESVVALMPFVLLKQLLGALQGPRPDVRTAIVFAFLILVCNVIRDQSGVFSLWYSRRCYERSRGEMITMIYEKTLRRKAFTFPGHHASDEQELSKVEAPASMGKILNLMRNDVYEVAQRFWEFPNLFIKPMNFILSLVLLWRMLGPASLLGILIVVLAQVVNGFVLRVLYRWELARRAVTDIKLQATSQFVEAIRHLRWYDWQDKWLGRIIAARNKELRWRVATLLLQRTVDLMNQLAAFFFPVAAFYAYTVIGKHPLSVDIAFPALGLFTILQTSLRELPALITVLVNAAVAMKRIEAFMAEPNKEEHFEDKADPSLGALEIHMSNASFSWPGAASNVLHDVTLTCGSGLTAVCGKVGSGKTALLQAILGELDQKGGEKKVPEEMIGYCTQTPWLQSMSIRENILFSAPYDERRYRQVLDACCLLPDLVNFKAGDLSLVGENGVGLSGGQKARVALARAVYSRARILLLDDPIAALDHNTAETIMSKLFKSSGLMKERLVVFVTHRVDLVTKYAMQTLEVNEGGTVGRIEEDLLDPDSKALHRITSNEDLYVEDDEQGENEAIPDKFIEEEYRAHGGVMASVYWRYVKAGKLRWWAAIIFCFIVFRAANVAYYYFLKIWGEAYDSATTDQPLVTSQTATAYGVWQRVSVKGTGDWFNHDDLGLPSPDDDVIPWLFWFFMLSVAQVVAQLLSDLVLIVLTYTAGKQIFEKVMHRVSNATFRFFDITPVGRLMNRVTSDIGTIDGQIAYQIYQCAYHSVIWISAMAVIASTTPIFLVLAIFMTATFILIFRRFLPATQSLRRLEMVSLSPLMSNFGTLLEGLTTVRAFHAQPHFQNRIIVTTDAFQKMDHFYWSLQAWLMYRFDMLSAISTFALTLVALQTGLSPGTVGFVLAAAANFVETTHALCRKYGDLQMQFVSVERVIELLDLEQEDEGDIMPPAAWPTANDDVVFKSATVRYAAHLDPSLNEVSMRIPARSTVAVTGRTGSGKSTLALALLGTLLTETSDPSGGGIWIGNMNVGRVNKHVLRQRISFVAQDPVLFPGTLRENLDPVGDHSDEECAAVLERVMRGSGGHFTLSSRIDGGGKNLSQGQRQLVGLGRAVLRRSPVVILDEATASIDMKTAFYIQEVLREELKDSTVITIAHRLEAVKDADFSIVLDKGRVVYAGPAGAANGAGADAHSENE